MRRPFRMLKTDFFASHLMADALPSDDVNFTAPSLPPQSVHTTWTLLLIVHLAAVALAVQSNTLPASPLRAKLGDTPLALYLDVFHMNKSYAFHMTDGDTLDFDHSIEIELDPDTIPENAGESSEEKPVVLRLPEEGIWPGVRKRRLQHLALAIADRAEGDPTFAALLPGGVANGMLSQAGVTSGTHHFRCQRQQNVILEDASHPDRARSDPYHANRFQTAYEASLICDNGRVDIVKIVSKSERAAVRRSQKTDGTDGTDDR